MLVCEKLLNFTKIIFIIGIILRTGLTEEDNCQITKVVQQPMDLGTILDKLFLDIYKKSISLNNFWIDVGLVFKNCLKFNKKKPQIFMFWVLTFERMCYFPVRSMRHHLGEPYNQLNTVVDAADISRNSQSSKLRKG